MAVLEVGLGGRLDSTNVCHPLVSVITSISLDHTRQLGNTLDSIAREKAGILTEVRRREYYDKPSVRRKKKAAAARKRALKKLKRMAR